MNRRFSDGLKAPLLLAALLALSACAKFQYRPVETIGRIDRNSGYRLETAYQKTIAGDDMLVVLMFSGGGTRAAALGYGVLEELDKQEIYGSGKRQTMLEAVDVVYGVSGGSVLAAYFSLHGKDTVPAFERRFLKQNFQRQVSKQFFSFANLPRLTSPEFGRGDLLQEQFESTLFKNTTFGDLAARRKGPFAVITATDMSVGNRFEFTQEYFDAMCLNLSDLPVARAVAASSAVPLVFSPLTLNNNGGNCGYRLPERVIEAVSGEGGEDKLQQKTRLEMLVQNVVTYQDSKKRPYIHLLDGGLTDNLGLRSLLDINELYGNTLYSLIGSRRLNKIVIINVNAQNDPANEIDASANVPGLRAVTQAIVDIPIDRYSQETLRRFRAFVDQWNADVKSGKNTGKSVDMYFVSLNLRDLPDSALRRNVLNIPTSFYLPAHDVNNLKEAGRALLAHSQEYRHLLQDLALPAPAAEPIPEPQVQSKDKTKEAAANAAPPEQSASAAQAQ
ncbi:patatin-like phospholipase family protein [Neisseria sp. 23W00296]|uniref:patatin-like phospholipase family protein n=1 Tax=unclassified Neisseria TaxID=2623750 RepID=UPI0002A3F8FB|nr:MULTISPECIES: patatin-like phospholipase family protein [unclassified Neisseria]ASP18125.1 patatin [Neisseria sp. KEM232]EKY06820.1 phospholipase, patatin family [Neisseria sp. oral taxon 020 str. F0370]